MFEIMLIILLVFINQFSKIVKDNKDWKINQKTSERRKQIF